MSTNSIKRAQQQAGKLGALFLAYVLLCVFVKVFDSVARRGCRPIHAWLLPSVSYATTIPYVKGVVNTWQEPSIISLLVSNP